MDSRADSRLAPSQWETALFCNAVSHWPGANLESALHSMSCSFSSKFYAIFILENIAHIRIRMKKNCVFPHWIGQVLFFNQGCTSLQYWAGCGFPFNHVFVFQIYLIINKPIFHEVRSSRIYSCNDFFDKNVIRKPHRLFHSIQCIMIFIYIDGNFFFFF